VLGWKKTTVFCVIIVVISTAVGKIYGIL